MMAAQSRQRWYLLQVGVLLHLVASCFGRIHQLQLTDEKRSNIQVNSFGFFANGTLAVDVDLSFASSGIGHRPIGFSLSHPKSSQFLSSTEQESLRCILEMEQVDKLLLIFNFTSIRAEVKKFGNFQQMHVSQVPLPTKKADGLEATPETRIKTSPASQKNKDLDQKEKSPVKKVKKRDTGDRPTEQEKKISGSDANLKSEVGTEDLYLPLSVSANVYHFSFQIVFSLEEEGLYNLYFHNCNNLQRLTTSYNITVHVTERNPEGFLSAAEIPLFKLYLIMAGSFFIASIVWIHILHKHKFSVFKIHWLMAGLVVTKSISLLFHSINYYFINIEGHPIEGLAVMYYITHLLKGVLLFITIMLIGTGWAFVKYILSDKDKKIFMIVLPLQVLANVAYIIMESTETGTSDYSLWTQIVFLVDLICCGAILFPVIWSIRHLQEASTTDGKAAMNLAKLKLFRHYYIMIVCYIYFTRIIAILLKVTVSFQLQWLHEMLVEVSTLVFFVLTGYKFRPASNNPYLQLPQEDEDIQMDEVLTESGALGGVSRVNKTFNGPEAL